MKTRLGFVSNSSSSSFVALGTKISTDLDRDSNEYDEWCESHPYIYDHQYIDGLILNAELDYTDDKEFTFGELYNIAKDIAERNGIRIEDVKLFTGTREC